MYVFNLLLSYLSWALSSLPLLFIQRVHPFEPGPFWGFFPVEGIFVHWSDSVKEHWWSASLVVSLWVSVKHLEPTEGHDYNRCYINRGELNRINYNLIQVKLQTEVMSRDNWFQNFEWKMFCFRLWFGRKSTRSTWPADQLNFMVTKLATSQKQKMLFKSCHSCHVQRKAGFTAHTLFISNKKKLKYKKCK